MGRLRDQIVHTGSTVATNKLAPQCALRKTCGECRQRGYQTFVQGAFVHAKVCDCVQQCQVCLGSTMMSIDSKSKPCRTPMPRRVSSLMNDACIPARYIDAHLADFRNLTGNGRDVQRKVKTWLDTFAIEKSQGLLLSGPVGVGKTYILAAIAKALIETGYEVKFVDFHRLLAVIRSAYTDRKSEEAILAPLINAEILVIDEFGKGRNNDWEQEKLDQIVMGRYNQNKMLLASTNYSLKPDSGQTSAYVVPLDQGYLGKTSTFNPDVFESLETRVGKRIYSRLLETTLMIDMQGDDYRRRIATREQRL